VIGFSQRLLEATPHYSVTELGTQGDSAESLGINDRQEIVLGLDVYNGASMNEVLLLDANGVQVLPSLGGHIYGFTPPNSEGVLVGSSDSLDGRRHAVLYANQQLDDWGSAGEIGSGLVAISNSGLIIGNIYDRESTTAVIYNGPNDIKILGTLGGKTSSASDVNNFGQVTGISLTGTEFLPVPTSTPYEEAFLYENGHMSGIGTLGGQISNGYAINDLGQIVGDSSVADGEMHAFVWDKVHGMHDLGAPGLQSIATLVNNQGTIVGEVEVVPGNQRAALFDPLTGFELLQELIPPNSGWTQLNYAPDINDLGQIVGTGIFNGESRAFLLTPTPEPSSIILAILAASGLFALCRSRGNQYVGK